MRQWGCLGSYRDLDVGRMDGGRTLFASRMVPFGARMVVERLECGRGKGSM